MPSIESTGYKILGIVVGSRHAGMACAADMAKAGCEVTVFEAFHQAGGVLKYGIPDFRLPNTVVDAEIGNLRKLGVKFECNTLVGRLFTIEQMRNEFGFDAVFIGTGAGYPSMLGIPAIRSMACCQPTNCCPLQFDASQGIPEFRYSDSARQARRRNRRRQHGDGRHTRQCAAGAEKVYCIYRRSRAECPARVEEVHHAEQEGVEFHWLTAPVEVLDDGKGNVRGMRYIKMELGEPDDFGRRRPVPVKGSEFEFECDQIVFAIGTNANPIIGQTSHLGLNKRGYIATDEISRPRWPASMPAATS